jgi:hypothetical protein
MTLLMMVISTLLLTAGTAGVAFAQDTPDRAPRNDEPVGVGRSLNVGVWFGGGRDQRLGLALPVRLGPVFDSGSNTQVGFGITSVRARERLTIGVDARSSVMLDSARSQLWAVDEQAAVTVSFRLTRRTRLDLAQSLKYAPVDYFGVLPDFGAGGATSEVTDLSAFSLPVNHALSSATGTALTRTIGRRSTLTLQHGFTSGESIDGRVLRTHLAGARFQRRLTTSGAFNVGYRVTSAKFGSDASFEVHDVDTGFGYARALPFSRRTTVAASTGSSILGDGSDRTFRVLATGSIAHTFTPSWRARVEYSRPVEYGGLGTVVVLDSLGLMVGGGVTRRSTLTLRGMYSTGTAGLDRVNNEVNSRSANIGWQMAITRRVSLHADGFYTRTVVDPNIALPPSIPRHVERIGIRTLLSCWLPVPRH